MADKPVDDSAPLTTAEILRRVAALPPEERKRAERALALQYQPSIAVNRTKEAEELEALGWEPWLTELAPHVFRGTHADFHRKFWNWYWPLLLTKRDGKRIVAIGTPLAYLLTLGRGMGKSTSVEWGTIALGALLGQTLTLYCHEKGTLIYDQDRPDASWQPVEEHPSARIVEREGLEIRVAGLPSMCSEVVTPEHRYWARRVAVRYGTKSQGTQISYGEPHWIEARHLDWNTWVGHPIEDSIESAFPLLDKWRGRGRNGGDYEPEEFPLFSDPDFWWMVGLWWGDGTLRFSQSYRGKGGYIIFSCSDDHPDIKNKLVELLAKWGYKAGQTRPRSGARLTDVGFSDAMLSRWLVTWKRGRSRKEPPAWVERLPVDFQIQLIRGYLDADGYCVSDRGVNLTSIHLPGLLAVRRMLARAGVRCTICSTRSPVHNTFPGGRVYKTARAYKLTIEHPNALGLFNNPRKEHDLSPVFVRDGFIWSRVLDVKNTGPRTFVPIQTKSESYLTAFGRSHNCSSTQKQARQHLNNIREEIEDSQITKFYPGLANPEVGKFNNRYGWNQDLLATTSGLTIFAVGLEEEVRGVKRRQLRPSLILLDEFDSKGDSPDVVKKKESIIAGSIFGTQVEDTIIVMAQNLIHGQSVATRTVKRRNELLSHRIESGLIKAFTDDFEVGMVGTRYMRIHGTPTWDYFKVEGLQKVLDTAGPIEAFAEYQHQFDHSKEGRVLKNYNDKIMVITEEDFFNVYRCYRPPASWNKYVGNDKARTKTEWHANVAGTLTMSGMNTQLPGVTFLYDCLSFEENTEVDDCAIEILKCISPTIFVDGIEYRWDDLLQEIIAREGIDKFTRSLTEKIRVQREGLAKIIPKYVHPLLASQHYIRFRMSHEADDWRRIYRETFGLPFEPAVPTEGAGVDLINFSMKIDPRVQDPFSRLDLAEDGSMQYDELGQPKRLMGMSRFYIIVPKDKLPYPDDNKPDLLHGSDLARYQFTEHRYLSPKQNAEGEKERGQEKRNDDWINLLQFFYMDYCIKARELTPQEMAEITMAQPLQLASIAAEQDPETREHMMMAREVALKREAYARIQKQLGSGGRARPGNRMANMRAFDRLKR